MSSDLKTLSPMLTTSLVFMILYKYRYFNESCMSDMTKLCLVIKFKMQFTWCTFGHDREEHPRSKLIGIVGTGDEVEEFGEGVCIGNRNTPHFGAGRAQVLQQNVDAQVTEFTKLQNEMVYAK